MNKLFKQLLMAVSCLAFVVGMPACRNKCCKTAKTECCTKTSCHQDKETDMDEVMDEDDMDMDDSGY